MFGVGRTNEYSELYYSCRSSERYMQRGTVRVFGVERTAVAHMGGKYELNYLIPIDEPLVSLILDRIVSGEVGYPPKEYSRQWFLKQSRVVEGVKPMSREWLDDHYWDCIIEHPLDSGQFIWPVDVVKTPQGRQLVFPGRFTDGYRPLSDRLSNINNGDPRLSDAQNAGRFNDRVRDLAQGLISVFAELESNGYIYANYDLDHMYYREGNPKHILCDFSQAVHPLQRPDSKSEAAVTYTDHLTCDFIDPFAWQESRKNNNGVIHIDRYSQNFVFAAMMFRLLIGRLPYDGKAIDSVWSLNVDRRGHDQWLQYYHAHPVFIFDGDNTGNSVGGPDATTIDRYFVRHWEELEDPLVASTFSCEFSTSNAMRTFGAPVFLTIKAWREVLNSILE